MSASTNSFQVNCPVPFPSDETVQLGHGGGGRLMQRLLQNHILPALHPGGDGVPMTDAATLPMPASDRLAFTTDSYVIRPVIFPGGNIGSLAIHGTVNDLAMAGARPLYISMGLVLEEGFPLATLRAIMESAGQAAREIGVRIVTGDTKVVDRGKGDGIYINTAGIGAIETPLVLAPEMVEPGDVVIINGDLGRHGIAVMAVREGLEFETEIQSDSAPLHEVVHALIRAGVEIHCMRDLTRGGLSSGLNEIAEARKVTISLQESAIPIREDVRGACEMLGLDPLYVANEGRFAVFVPERDAGKALDAMHGTEQGTGAVVIGRVGPRKAAPVLLETSFGPARIVDMLAGEQLPRIC